MIKEVISNSVVNKIEYKPVKISKEVQGKIYNYSSIEILNINGDSRERCFALDASISHDRFVIMGGYNETIDIKKMELFIDDEMEVILTNKKPIIDILIVIEPTEGYPIGYLEIGNILTLLLKAFPNMVTFNSDHFQNEKLTAELISKGIRSETYFFNNSTQIKLYTKLRWNVWNRNIEICKDVEPGHKIKVGNKYISLDELWVLEGEKLIKEGVKIDHPKGFSKDLQDVTAILNHDLLNLEVNRSIVYITNIEALNDIQFRELVYNYMDESYELNRLDDPPGKEEQRKILCKKVGLNYNELVQLEKYVKEMYGDY
jgi:hypothetical protein